MVVFFLFFLVSGLSSLIYQVVWLRIAMANFGVTTPFVSIVLSVFMAGLALGSWAGGKFTQHNTESPASFFVRRYAVTELAIGVSGLVVPPLLRLGRVLFEANSANASWGSATYYLLSMSWILLVMLPFCTCMGATFPLAMAGIRAAYPGESPRSFSYLYLANVMGAIAGTLGSAFFLIEWVGFPCTLWVASSLNAILGIGAFLVARTQRMSESYVPPVQPALPPPALPKNKKGKQIPAVSFPASVKSSSTDPLILPFLFLTGLCSLGMEVIWTRQFTPFLGPLVYSFAAMLAVYLGGTAIGSCIYRFWAKANPSLRGKAWDGAVVAAAACALLPLVGADPRVALAADLPGSLVRVALSLGPFCCALGFLTPLLVDRWSDGSPERAAKAYAVNALGCIIGPLVAAFALLPQMGEGLALVVLTAPLVVFPWLPGRIKAVRGSLWLRILGPVAAAAAAVALIVYTRDFGSLYPQGWKRRDHTATVIATGQGMQKQLLVNGVGVTSLTPITKMMVHLPAALLPSPPRNILILCFGMGTSYRSALSWGGAVTVVDLIPSVPPMMGYFHADGDRLLQAPRGTIVIDDARRYLERTSAKFDLIVIDPPPPVEAAASSLLYSREFYAAAAQHLQRGGILQQWLPEHKDAAVVSAMAQALARSFPEHRVFRSVENWGRHFILSMAPIPKPSAATLAARLPPAAASDLIEWGPHPTPEIQFRTVLERELPLSELIQVDPRSPMLTDDHPVNEYFLLRRLFLHPEAMEKIVLR